MLTIERTIDQVHRAAFDFEVPPMDDMQDLVRMRFLYQAVLDFGDPRLGGILEIGCFKGCSTVFLAKAAQKRGFTGLRTIDLFTGTPSWGVCVDTLEEARGRFRDYDLASFVLPLRTDSAEYDAEGPLAVLHVDGDHAYDAVRSDLFRFGPQISSGGIVVIDDYDSGHEGVMRATHEFLAEHAEFAIVAVNNSRRYYGSVCLRRRPVEWAE